MELRNHRVLVIGMARSGIAAARFLNQKGAKVTITDLKTKEAAGQIADDLAAQGIELHLGGYPEVHPNSFDLVVPSPGVPLEVPPLVQAQQAKVPIIGELELAFQFAQAPMVAITGTNGKTTTTSLLGEIFRRAERKTFVAGNIGKPLVSEIEAYDQQAVVVAEVSSFQLETIWDFRPQVALILNLTPDHLDRHKTMEGYRQAKANIFRNQTPQEFTVLNYDDELVRTLADDTQGQVIFFSRQHKLDAGVYVQDEKVVLADSQGVHPLLPVKQIGIIGSHNLENALAATAAAASMGVDLKVIAQTLEEFAGVAHRLEYVTEFKGIRFINDSKGTNPDAAIKALEAFEQPIVLIAGGKTKGSDFGELAAKIKQKVKMLVLVGEAANTIETSVRNVGFSHILRATTFPEAVQLAAGQASKGDVVLLSPACASWDMFNNFEERGDLFKQVVNDLRG